MLPPLRCRICRRQRPAHSSGFCACGASVWELIEHEPPPGVAVESLSGAPALEPVNFNCVLSEALGGVVHGRKIAIGGEPGAGKSTVCAELASKIFRLHREGVFAEFALSKAVTDLVAGLIAPDLDCFLSQFIFKNPGAWGQPWHQDSHYFPFEPARPVT